MTEFVGFLAGAVEGGMPLGLAAALVTLWMTFIPCFLWIFAGAPYVGWASAIPRLSAALAAITAAVVGVILNLSIWFAAHVFFAEVTRFEAGPVGMILPVARSLDPVALALAGLAGILLLVLRLPLLAVLGSPVTWVLMAFFLATLWGVWFAIMKNREHRTMHEDLVIWPDRMQLQHVQPRRAPLEWEANPYWVSVPLHEKGGPVENYLTLRGSDREVELGAFLSPEERAALRDELTGVLARIR